MSGSTRSTVSALRNHGWLESAIGIWRTVVLRWVSLLLLLLPTLGWSSAKDDRPNIIFILADDLGYADLGCYGQQVIQTPHLDQMAREGMKFTQFYAGSTTCAPSRSVFMTGLHTGHTRVRGNFGKFGVKGLGGKPGRVGLEDQDVTVAEVLQAAGYHTGMTGKWGLGEPGTAGVPHRQGFDEFLGFLNQKRAHSYYPRYIWKDQERYLIPGNDGGQQKVYVHDLFTNFALDFIDRHRGERFFLYLPYTIPHTKYQIPDTAPYQDEPWKQKEKIYAAMVTRLDRDVGRLLARLQEDGIDRNTIVFFCSDNGAARRWEGRFDSCGPLRGGKRDLYEGGIRSPMIVRWPAKVPTNRTSDAVCYAADIMPTLADLARTESPAVSDGVSMLPAILGGKAPSPDRMLYWEFHEDGFQQAARWRDWKVVRLGTDQPLKLYDLSQDVGETTNVAADHPKVVATIEGMLRGARTDSPNWPVENSPDPASAATP